MQVSVRPHLVGRREFSPRFICSPVVVMGVRGLDILVETQDLPRLEFRHRGSLGELRAEQNQQVYFRSGLTQGSQWFNLRVQPPSV